MVRVPPVPGSTLIKPLVGALVNVPLLTFSVALWALTTLVSSRVPLLVKPLATASVAPENEPSPWIRRVDPTAVLRAPLTVLLFPRTVRRPLLVNGAARVLLVMVSVFAAALVRVPGPFTVVLTSPNAVVALVKFGVRLKATPLKFSVPAPPIEPPV